MVGTGFCPFSQMAGSPAHCLAATNSRILHAVRVVNPDPPACCCLSPVRGGKQAPARTAIIS